MITYISILAYIIYGIVCASVCSTLAEEKQLKGSPSIFGFFFGVVAILYYGFRQPKKVTYSDIQKYANTLRLQDKKIAKISISLNYPQLDEKLIDELINDFPSIIDTYQDLKIGDAYSSKSYGIMREITALYSDGTIITNDSINGINEWSYDDFKKNHKKI